MKKLALYCFFIFLVCLLLNCKINKSVISDSFLTKRKYTKGWYLNPSIKISRNRNTVKEETEKSTQEDVTENTIQIHAEMYSSLNANALCEKKRSEFNEYDYDINLEKDSSKKQNIKTNSNNKFNDFQTQDSSQKITNTHAKHSFFMMLAHMTSVGIFLIAMHNNNLLFSILVV